MEYAFDKLYASYKNPTYIKTTDNINRAITILNCVYATFNNLPGCPHHIAEKFKSCTDLIKLASKIDNMFINNKDKYNIILMLDNISKQL
ncbi:hypothetical protein [Alphaentomopoxvirus acuprea]|uniref:Uncharacterized protein n=1 Tax=Alphaentomopoxvirus acuprea TaxID=62099 RepID=W6JL40_9POXV|nr:hypothetical protein BA82_gp195 [Anomala cuprea entomopoxvirus]BAO49555.1 hypothetical protein [Anomala cuprea entomopoxvirus]